MICYFKSNKCSYHRWVWWIETDSWTVERLRRSDFAERLRQQPSGTTRLPLRCDTNRLDRPHPILFDRTGWPHNTNRTLDTSHMNATSELTAPVVNTTSIPLHRLICTPTPNLVAPCSQNLGAYPFRRPARHVSFPIRVSRQVSQRFNSNFGEHHIRAVTSIHTPTGLSNSWRTAAKRVGQYMVANHKLPTELLEKFGKDNDEIQL